MNSSDGQMKSQVMYWPHWPLAFAFCPPPEVQPFGLPQLVGATVKHFDVGPVQVVGLSWIVLSARRAFEGAGKFAKGDGVGCR
jgi:hypothetical protein